MGKPVSLIQLINFEGQHIAYFPNRPSYTDNPVLEYYKRYFTISHSTTDGVPITVYKECVGPARIVDPPVKY
jgi:hypothetical protein